MTVDALNCQRTIAQQIIDQGGDYAFALKGNQGTLHDDIGTFLNDPLTKATTEHSTVRRSWPHRNPRRRDLDGY